MKTRFVAPVLSCFLLMLILFLAAPDWAAAQAPGSVVVHGKFGGLIFGFDIDPNGTEGILSEAVIMQDGTVLAATETFDQTTGKIIKVLAKSQTHDDFVGWGVSGNHVGLVGREHVISPFNVQRTYLTVNPLDGNKLTAPWTPPIGSMHVITEITRDTGSNDVAVLATDVSGRSIPFVFHSNVGANTFGPSSKLPTPISTSKPTLCWPSTAFFTKPSLDTQPIRRLSFRPKSAASISTLAASTSSWDAAWV